MIYRYLLILACILFPVANVYAQGRDIAILNIPCGARVLGLGGAFCGQADDLSSSYYNPAGLINLKGREIMAYKTKLQNEVDCYFLSFGSSYSNKAFSLSWLQTKSVDFPIIQRTQASPTEDIHAESQTNFQSHLISFAYAHSINPKLSIGLSSSIFFSNFDNLKQKSSLGFSLSLGLHYKMNNHLNLGICLKDVINFYKFKNTKSERGLTKLIVGLNFKPNTASNINFDLSIPISKNISPIHTYFGMEYSLPKYMDLRFGLFQKMPTFGVSLKGNYAVLSYTHLFSSRNFLGENNMLSLKIRF